MSKRKKTTKSKTDAVEVALFDSLLVSVAEEMGASLIRSALSPNIKERRDCSCAVFDSAGKLVAQAAHVPVHLGAMPRSVESALSSFEQLGPGDAVLLNDPFLGGTHLPDLTVVTPVYTDRRHLAAYLASRAHHADVGGMTPGSLPLSTEIYQEGLRIPPVLIRQDGRINDAVSAILLANSRTPEERLGDVHAQLASHDIGAERIAEMVARYGKGTVSARMTALCAYGRRRMSVVLRNIPDGTYTYEDRLDNDGVSDTPQSIRVRIVIAGARATVDFSGTSPSCQGNLNAVLAITESAVYYCFLAIMVTRGSDAGSAPPPLNAGCFAPIDVFAPQGTLVNAQVPHAVATGNLETAQRIVDVVLGALSSALPDVIPAASQGTMNNTTLGGYTAEGTPFAYYETVAGGQGGHPEGHGQNAVQAHMTNTLNTPIEALEFSYPFRIERYEIIPGSGGRGRHHGGHGIRRDLRVLCPATGTLLCDRQRIAPYGLHGGSPGRTGRNALIRDGRTTRLPGKVELALQADDIIRVETPGGGGWGSVETT
jgi:N-methylhydantoinase B